MTAAFLSPLRFEDDGGFPFTFIAPLSYGPTFIGGQYVIVTVPAGERTDLASIPRLLWVVLPPVGREDPAAGLHDYLYQHAPVWRLGGPATTRAEADHVLLEAMTVLGVPWWQRWAIYLGVRAGGWVVWNRYRAKEPQAA